MAKRLWVGGLSCLLLACGGDGLGPLLPPCTSSGAPVNLAEPGQYTAFDPAVSSGCTVFPTNGSGAQIEYLLVPQSGSGTPNDSEGFRLGGALLAAAGITSELVASGAPPTPLGPAEQFHRFLRQAERTRSYPVPPRPEFAPTAQLAPQVTTITPVDSGHVGTFKVCGDLQCKTLPKVTATAMKVGQHVAIYVDNNAPQPGLTQTDLDALRDVFDNRLYAVDLGAFGTESDIDSNSVVIVLMTNRVNQLVPAPTTCPEGFVAGYFFGADIDPSFRGQYNDAEIFYTMVPDPDGTLSCAHPVSQVKRVVPVTLVHEFQHMISYNWHVVRPGTGDGEVLWLNEALSHYAEERGARSFLPDTASFCQFVVGDVANSAVYFGAPQDHFLVDTSGIGGLAERGAYWLFIRYLIDQYAGGTTLAAADAYTRMLVQTTATGVTNVVQHAGNTPFATLVSRWALANYVSDLPAFPPPSELTYASWRFRTDYPLLRNKCASSAIPATLPLVPGGPGPGGGVNLSGVLRAGSGTYYRVQQDAGAAGFTLLFSDGTGRALRRSLVPRLNVIRIQ